MTITARAIDATTQLTAAGAPFELIEIEQGDQRLPIYKQAPHSLAEVIRQSRRDDDQCFLVYQTQRWSYRCFFEHVDAIASWLLQQGVCAGQPVAIAMRNRPEWAAAFAATALIGAVPAPLNSFGLTEELHSALAELMPPVLICDTDRWLRLQGKALAVQGQILVVGDLPDGDTRSEQAALVAYDSLLSAPKIAIPEVALSPEDPALILFTSGATSRAKAVLSSQRAVCQALYNIDYIGAVSAMVSPEKIAKIIQQGNPPVILTAVPLFHVSGLHAQFLAALRAGRRLVFMHRWEPKEAIAMMKAERVTQFNGAPSMVMQLLREPEFFEADLQSHFAGLGFGGAGLSQSIIETVLAQLPEKMVGVGFGMTESNGVGSAASGDLFSASPKSSGLLSPLIKVRVCNAEGEVLKAGAVGEIQLQGITLMQGYLNNPSATQAALPDGWLRTGDLGYLDEAGFLFIVDRLKDVINRAGENIAAAEVESCLVKHDQVLEAAVFGIPHEATGEAVIAVVSVNPQSDVSEASLKAHVAAHLAAYKVPLEIHITQEGLPHNPAGKLLKMQLKKALLTSRQSTEQALC